MTVPPPPQDPYAQQPPQGPGPFAPPPMPARHAPGTDLGSDLGGALSFAWSALIRNPVAFLVTGLIYSIVMALLLGGGTVLGFLAMLPQLEAATTSEAAGTGAILTFYAIILGAALLSVPLALLWQAGSAGAGGIVLEGGRPGIGRALFGPGRVLGTAVLVSLICFIGSLLLYIPGLIASVMLMYAVPAAVRGASPTAAISESFSLAKTHLGTTVVAFLVLMAISSVAGMLIVTVIALVPFLVLFQIGIYERLSGRELPDPALG